MRKFKLFLSIVWRQWETPGSIPESYRIHYRLTVRDAWEIARRVYM